MSKSNGAVSSSDFLGIGTAGLLQDEAQSAGSGVGRDEEKMQQQTNVRKRPPTSDLLLKRVDIPLQHPTTGAPSAAASAVASRPDESSHANSLRLTKQSEAPVGSDGVVVVAEADPPPPVLSKNAKKKMARWERKMELKRKKKQQDKEVRHARARAQGRDLDEERRLMRERTEEGSAKRRRVEAFEKVRLPLALRSFQICVDCGFEGQLTDREVGSLAKQLRYCYSLNRKTSHPCVMSVTGLGGETLRHLQNVSGYDEWTTYAYSPTEQPLEEHFKDRLSDVVYLTSDAETMLDDLEDTKVYVIGGIVDRNRLKGVTYQKAMSLNVRTAKLPLSEHLTSMPTTPVLTVNHVFELLLKYREHGRDWKKAMEAVIPQRKHAEFEAKETRATATALNDDTFET
jgi:tRNA (guanine9-N1)-methyltransferase